MTAHLSGVAVNALNAAIVSLPMKDLATIRSLSSKAFSRDKLFRGILIACAKRPITPEQISDIIDNIERELRSNPRNEITSKELGDLTLSYLADLDEVAYIRFASVYKDFQNIEEFSNALHNIHR